MDVRHSASGTTGFHVEPAALESASELLVAFEESTESFIAEIDRKVDQLHIEWQGQAAASHIRAHQQWAKGAADMRKSVAELGVVVGGAHRNYAAAVARNSSMWKRS
ncbi:WXG100 family type VII secretion target [Gordonia sp. DT219]|uniref:WXG100 family type VII secretion target n=1 Tax=Gordonia sp. DT219 TaxID=3416658 RepID=UPI003CF0721A